MEEVIRAKGTVRVSLRNVLTGEIVESHDYNLIVSVGKTILAKLLGGDAAYAGLEHISKIAFGTGSTAAATTDTALESEQLAKDVTVSYPAFNKVMFAATMGADEGGSLTYQEMGLKSDATGILFSRIVINPIAKSTLYEIDIEWTISFQ